MQKRGQLNLGNQVIIEIILLVLIVGVFFYFHTTVQKNTLYEQSYAARDIALLLETSQSVPGDVTLFYSQPSFDVGAYSYDLSDNLLRVYQTSSVTAITYPFFLDARLYQTLGVFEHPGAFYINKEKGTFTVEEHGSVTLEEKKELRCPSVASTKTTQLSFVVLSDETVFSKVQNDLLNNPKLGFAKTHKEEVAITSQTNLVLILSTQEGSDVAAYISQTADEQSEKLGCLFENNILSQFADASLTGPLASSEENLNKNTAGLAVHLVIGTDLLTESSALTSAITNGLEEYYND
ncbi:hypothetical protein HZC31_02190 [Candidatus Woesearchaeota archaeon]|nr:hypothetical protein [Candidatus Woesearchaeota archaeon]